MRGLYTGPKSLRDSLISGLGQVVRLFSMDNRGMIALDGFTFCWGTAEQARFWRYAFASKH